MNCLFMVRLKENDWVEVPVYGVPAFSYLQEWTVEIRERKALRSNGGIVL